jgi:hypothetical protein
MVTRPKSMLPVQMGRVDLRALLDVAFFALLFRRAI